MRHGVGSHFKVADRNRLAVAAKANVDAKRVVLTRAFEGAVAEPDGDVVAARQLEHAADMIRMLVSDDDTVDLLGPDLQARQPAFGLPHAESAIDHHAGLRRSAGGSDQQGIALAAAA